MGWELIAASLFGVGVRWRSGKIKTAVPPVRARLIGGGPRWAQIGEWGVFNLPIMAIRAVPRDGVGAESARALCVSPKVLDSPGGAKSSRHSPPVHADPLPWASAKMSRRAARFWRCDAARLQRPLARFPVLDARGSPLCFRGGRICVCSEERGERGRHASPHVTGSDFESDPRHPLGDPIGPPRGVTLPHDPPSNQRWSR